MTGKTHIIGGVTSSLLFINGCTISEIVIGVMISSIASIVPDIDHSGTYVSKLLPFISKPYNYIKNKLGIKCLGHRKFTHSIFPILLCSGGVIISQNINVKFFTVGLISHFILDSFTKNGIRVLSPISNVKFRMGWMVTGEFGEKCFSIMLYVFAILLFARFLLDSC